MRPLVLHIDDGKGEQRRVEIEAGEQPIWLGRDASCEVVLAAPQVSRKNATMVARLEVRVNERGAVLLRDTSPSLIRRDYDQLARAECQMFAQERQRRLSDAAATDHDRTAAELNRRRRAARGTHGRRVTRTWMNLRLSATVLTAAAVRLSAKAAAQIPVCQVLGMPACSIASSITRQASRASG